MASSPAGLCGLCVHQRVVRNTRGSSFSLCELARRDPAFAKYPRLPVLECRGFAASAGRADEDPAAATRTNDPFTSA